MPRRIQRRRTAGWRTPECGCGCGKPARYVGRPTKWGNPWTVHVHTLRCAPLHALCPLYVADDRADATRKYRHAVLYPLIGQPHVPTPDEIRAELRGHDLTCWCPLDQPCHASILLELANA